MVMMCEDCNGEGVIYTQNHLGIEEWVECPMCAGTGVVDDGEY